MKDLRVPPVFKYLLKLTLGITLLVLLFHKINYSAFLSVSSRADLGYLCLGSLLFMLLVPMESARVVVVFKDYSLTYWKSIEIYLIGTFFTNFMPGNIGSEVYTVACMHSRQKGLKKPAVHMLMLRVNAVIILLSMALIYAVSNWEHVSYALLSGNISLSLSSTKIVFLLLVFFIMFIIIGIKYKKLLMYYEELVEGLGSLSKSSYITITALSILINIFRILSYYFFIRAFRGDIFILDLIIVTAFSMLISYMPVSIGSLGVREGAITASLFIFGVTQPIAAAVAVATRLVLWFISLVGGILYFAVKKYEII